MQRVGYADVLLYFKCPTTKQMRCPVNGYGPFIGLNNLTNPTDEFKENRYLRVKAWFILPRAGNSRFEWLTGVAVRAMACSLFLKLNRVFKWTI
jgi:hypothetical protein